MKLLVVGCANKGRTSVVKKLGKKTVWTLTHSNLLFEIDEWTYSPSANASPINFNIYDFSGKVL